MEDDGRMDGFINLSIIGIIIKAGAEEESLLRSAYLLRLAITDGFFSCNNTTDDAVDAE